MSVHPDMTALRAVDACGGTYTPAEEASGFAAGHRAALASAMVSVGAADGLTAELMKALDNLSFTIGVTAIKHASQLPDLQRDIDAARAVVAKATGSEVGA